jgi:leucyl-tRNA synthetase
MEKVVESEKSKTAFIVHGLGANIQANFFPWLKLELEKLGYDVVLEDMPNSDKPKLKEWLAFLNKYQSKINENTIIIGHSLGGKVAAYFVSQLKQKIKAFYSVAPVNRGIRKNLTELKNSRSDLNIKYAYYIAIKSLDWNNVIRNAENVLVLLSDNDPLISYNNSKSYYSNLNVNVLTLKNREHVLDPTLPELLNEIKKHECYCQAGKAINSDFLNGLNTKKAKEKIIKYLEENNLGKKTINYKLRDWCVSRQRYWGPPIPMVYCKDCGWLPVPEKDLPVKLPPIDDFHPDGSGKGPLNKVKEFVKTKCPKCKKEAKRETDVSDPFVDSCWYYFRYLNTENNESALNKERIKKWMPIDMYIGGKEHTVLHLLYSRFVTMVLHDYGYCGFEEPFGRFFGNGLLIKDGAKMSKSKGNVINPDDYIKKFGADSVRFYLMFLGEFSQGGDWRDSGMNGMYRFVKKLFNIYNSEVENLKNADSTNVDSSSLPILHQTIKRVTLDIERLSFNTAIARIMELVNWYQDNKKNLDNQSKYSILSSLAILISPFAPHLGEEFWAMLNNKRSVFKTSWPQYIEKYIKENKIELVIQINGKIRNKLQVKADITQKEALNLAKKDQKIIQYIKNKKIKKEIFIPGKLVNIVV